MLGGIFKEMHSIVVQPTLRLCVLWMSCTGSDRLCEFFVPGALDFVSFNDSLTAAALFACHQPNHASRGAVSGHGQ